MPLAEGTLTGNEIREKFLEYFEKHGHRRVRSSSLVPHGDPTLLFTNAGMNQFKDVFLGLEQRDYRRATSVQKCVRAGGKHNDLENVGRTARHHTFFEMLGNFSFGDYFKKDAIAFAWELVTSPKWFGIPKEKLYATVFKGEEGIARDEEAYKHWISQGVPKERIYEFGIKDNFWAMGDTGPCGPCSEIHYDMGPAASDEGHTDCKFGCECGRYVEIWNLVFMQFNRDAEGKMTPLPKPCVDTGAGLERFAATMLNVQDPNKFSNYDTDLLRPLIDSMVAVTGKAYGNDGRIDTALRVIADHLRAMSFLISDGVSPSNEGRGYVLRKIIRRAIDFGRALGLEEPCLYKMSAKIVDLMGSSYPELVETSERVARAIRDEEEKYARLIVPSLQRFFARLAPRAAAMTSPTGIWGFDPAKAEEVTGEDLFFAYDTLGLRADFMRDVLQHRGWRFAADADVVFEAELAKQRERAKASWKGAHKEVARPVYTKLAETFKTEPDFYYGTNARDCRIEAIVTKDGQVNEVKPGAEAEIILDRTVIYAEAGGQVADVGAFYDNSQSLEVAEVRGAYYPVAGLIAHRVVAKEDLQVGDRVAPIADAARREHIKRNHTATHLVHAALRNILGTHVKQAGSLVAPDHLRFDFSHFTGVDADELHEIEQQVNDEILRNSEIQTDVTSLDEALASGALAFFGDKYPEQNVRVVTIPDPAAPRGFYSKELCGGTHVRRTGDIGVFKIVAEQSVAAGTRRIEAISGARALADYQRALAALRQLAATLNVGEDAVTSAVERLAVSARQMEKQLEALKRKGALSKVDDLMEQVRTVKDVRVISAQVEQMDREAMRQLVDTLRQKLGSGVVVLGTAEDGKVAIITGVTKDLTSRLHAGKIVQALAREVGGSGGGRPDLAEAGGKDTTALKRAIEQVYAVVAEML